MLLENIIRRIIKVLEVFLITITTFYYISSCYMMMKRNSLLSIYLLALSGYFYVKSIRGSRHSDTDSPDEYCRTDHISYTDYHSNAIVGVCTVCHRLRYATTRHCPFCDRCFNNRSHHCAWISGCVYDENKNDFLLFIFFLTVYAIVNINCLNVFVCVAGTVFMVLWMVRGNRMEWGRMSVVGVFVPWLERGARVVDEY